MIQIESDPGLVEGNTQILTFRRTPRRSGPHSWTARWPRYTAWWTARWRGRTQLLITPESGAWEDINILYTIRIHYYTVNSSICWHLFQIHLWVVFSSVCTSAVLIHSQQQSHTHITSEVLLMQSNTMSFILGPSSSSSCNTGTVKWVSECLIGKYLTW